MRGRIMSSDAAPAPERKLTILAIGHADSVHVAARVHCFAQMGHRVYLVTETPSSEGIDGVMELVPADDARSTGRPLRRVAPWLCRRIGGRVVDHARRAVGFVRLVRRCRP